MSIGELKVNWINLPAGEYKLVQKRNLEDIQPYVDDRNGTVNATSIASNSGYSIFLKGPSDDPFIRYGNSKNNKPFGAYFHFVLPILFTPIPIRQEIYHA